MAAIGLSVGGPLTDLHVELTGDGDPIVTIDTGPLFSALDDLGLGAVGDLVDSLGISLDIDTGTIVTLPPV